MAEQCRSIARHGSATSMPTARPIRDTPADIRSGEPKLANTGLTLPEDPDIFGLPRRAGVKDTYGA